MGDRVSLASYAHEKEVVTRRLELTMNTKRNGYEILLKRRKENR